MTKPIALIAAPNGASKQKADHPALPVTVEEIVGDAVACRDAGAAMVHLHARDSAGRHSLAVKENRALFDAAKMALGDSVIIQLTTEAVGRYSPAQQMTLIDEVQPPAASFALRELIPTESDMPQAERFFCRVADSGMLAQYILYDRADVERYLTLCRDNVLPKPGRHALLVLGRYHRQRIASPCDLLPLLSDELLKQERWGVCAFGPDEHRCLTTAMLLGADVRVGFENNHLDKNGRLAASNAAQVKALAEQADSLGLPLLDAHRYRTLLRGGKG